MRKRCNLRMENRFLSLVIVTTSVFLTLSGVCELKSVRSGAGWLRSVAVEEETKIAEEEDESEYVEYYDDEDQRDDQCEDDLPKENCSDVLSRGRCGDRQDMRAMLCMKSCGYCHSEESEEEGAKSRQMAAEDSAREEGLLEEVSSTWSPSLSSESAEAEEADDMRKECEDKMPSCSAHYSQEFCCQMKQAMNYSCEKTCKFCTQTPATLAPPGGMPLPPAQVPTATSNQDPCRNNEGQPPSVTVDGPGQPGGAYPGVTLTTTTTTTTSNPLATVLPSAPPGNPLTVPPSSGR